jgi:2-keto-4-pentenoate hydratase/2-oxohepta-3-ene-1,7-dioic acid hydratase in catechol pathway
MKIVVYGPEKRTGILSGSEVVDASLACAKLLRERDGKRNALDHAAVLVPSGLSHFIEGGDIALDQAAKAVDYLTKSAADKLGPRGETIVFDVAAVRLHAPRATGARVACAGGNFADHAAAMSERAVRRGQPAVFEGEPYQAIRNLGIWGFWKVDRESLGQDGVIPYPARCKRLDYEGELAIVIGKEGKDIPANKAKDHIWGVTLLGDWSVRMTAEPGPLKFALQKNFDGCCSIGPCIVVGGAVDPFDTWVETLVNGQRRQHFSTKDMVFTFGEYLEHLSRDFTFYAGDIISGGTAIGTAADSSPMLQDGTPSNETFINPGDSVEIRSPAIGSLRARVVDKREI